MPTVQSYQDLRVWRKAVGLAESIYRLTADFPPDEKYELTRQLRKAVVSVPANIAEGAGRNGTGEYIHFLGVASGSLSEADTHLILSWRLGITTEDQVRSVRNQAAEVGRMLAGLKRSLRCRLDQPSGDLAPGHSTH